MGKCSRAFWFHDQLRSAYLQFVTNYAPFWAPPSLPSLPRHSLGAFPHSLGASLGRESISPQRVFPHTSLGRESTSASRQRC